jgi:hypothetical protein
MKASTGHLRLSYFRKSHDAIGAALKTFERGAKFAVTSVVSILLHRKKRREQRLAFTMIACGFPARKVRE